MTPSELTQKIQELELIISEQNREIDSLKSTIKNINRMFSSLEELVKRHRHTGYDGTLKTS